MVQLAARVDRRRSKVERRREGPRRNRRKGMAIRAGSWSSCLAHVVETRGSGALKKSTT
jgi:hypothetical protein